MPTVRSFLDLSNLHLPPRFFQDGCDLSGRYVTEHGMLLWVPDSPEDIANMGEDDDSDDARPEVIAVRVYARQHGCDYILFDSDGPEEPDLPAFESAWRDDPLGQGDDEDTEDDDSADAPDLKTCGRCGQEYTGETCNGPGYHP